MSHLPRILNFRDLVLLTLGSVIGSGIFIVPAQVLQGTGGSLTPALLVWVAGGVLSVLGALTYGELGAMKPEAGGLYIYMRDAFGPFVAFMYGWALFLVVSSATVATLAVAFANYLGQFMLLSPVENKLVATATIVVMCVINVIGTRQSANVQNWATGIKVGAILLMSALLLWIGHGFSQPTTGHPPEGLGLLTSMGAGMIGVLWAYEGWQYVTFSAGETVEPQKNFARGIVVGTALLIFLYVLANVGYVAALGTERVATSERVASEAVAAVLGPTAGQLIALAILVSIYSAAHSILLTSPRVYYAMARDGLFFAKLAEVHPRWGTPAFSIIVSSIWSVGLALSGTFDQLLTYVVFVGWVFYALGAAAIFAYRRKEPDAPRPFRVPGYPLTPILFIVSAAGVVINTVWVSPKEALIGTGIVLLGLPAYWFWHGRAKPGASA